MPGRRGPPRPALGTTRRAPAPRWAPRRAPRPRAGGGHLQPRRRRRNVALTGEALAGVLGGYDREQIPRHVPDLPAWEASVRDALASPWASPRPVMLLGHSA